MKVVDASVAVKWLVPETGSLAAHALLAGTEALTAPALIRVEVTAAVTRKVRINELTEDEARTACDLWFSALAQGVVTLSRDEEDVAEAIMLALQIRHPLQDCLYLAVAMRLRATLVTADPKFAPQAKAAYGRVELLPGSPGKMT